MLHLIASHAPQTPVIFIDTGYLFPETYHYAEKLTNLLNINLKVYTPKYSVARIDALWGDLWTQGEVGENRYAQITKIEPMNRALQELNAQMWISGIRRSQSKSRTQKPFIEQQQTLKAYPILDWSDDDIKNYQSLHDLPEHPLLEKGYVTSGDTHSTIPLHEADNPEATRFSGGKYECSIMSTPQQNQEVAPNQEFHNSLWRGLLLAGAIAAIAFGLNQIPALRRVNPMLVAVFIGILVQSFLTIPKSCTSGINFSLQKLLKIAIVLLGLQLSFTQLLDVGLQGLLAIMLTLGTTFLFCVWLGKQLGLDPKLTRLIAAGTSICGASAIVATNSVVRGKDEHVAYSITVVTLFGFLSMLLFPVIGRFLELDPTIFGFWSGTSIPRKWRSWYSGKTISCAFPYPRHSYSWISAF